IGDEGIVALVTNNGFLDNLAFDGMRKHLYKDFSRIYILDLKGNVRKDSMRDGIPIGEKHTVFGLSAMIGISVTFFVKCKNTTNCEIFYSAVDWKATRQEKFSLIENAVTYSKLESQSIQPDKKQNWLTEGLHLEFDDFLPLGSKEAKKAKIEPERVVFKTYSGGVKTNRDAWAYNCNKSELIKNMQRCINTYNEQVEQWINRKEDKAKIDDFVVYDDKQLSWSLGLKNHLKSGKQAIFLKDKIRNSLYRPFMKTHLFFDRVMNEAIYRIPSIFPTPSTESENRVICVCGYGRKPFSALMSDCMPDINIYGDPQQAFPLYTYTDNTRQDNITDWTLSHFQTHYTDTKITKLDIFHYV
ncbi:MAG: DNA helicase, partial [Thiomargarita sp.]|nr:DNA helicase [Thiomargarita sp.]